MRIIRQDDIVFSFLISESGRYLTYQIYTARLGMEWLCTTVDLMNNAHVIDKTYSNSYCYLGDFLCCSVEDVVVFYNFEEKEKKYILTGSNIRTVFPAVNCCVGFDTENLRYILDPVNNLRTESGTPMHDHYSPVGVYKNMVMGLNHQKQYAFFDVHTLTPRNPKIEGVLRVAPGIVIDEHGRRLDYIDYVETPDETFAVESMNRDCIHLLKRKKWIRCEHKINRLGVTGNFLAYSSDHDITIMDLDSIL